MHCEIKLSTIKRDEIIGQSPPLSNITKDSPADILEVIAGIINFGTIVKTTIY